MQVVRCDALVVGSGAGGLAAAVTARKLGLDVICLTLGPAMTFGWIAARHLAGD